jgi:hypothetical protein
MKFRLLHGDSAEQAEFPPLSLDPPSLTIRAPAPVPEVPPQLDHHEPDWRGRTARTQYLDSEIYQPLSSMLLGFDARRASLIAVLALYNGVIGWLAWDAASASGEVMPILIVLATGAVVGWAAERLLRAYRPQF